jgi:hypothetical protein
MKVVVMGWVVCRYVVAVLGHLYGPCRRIVVSCCIISALIFMPLKKGRSPNAVSRRMLRMFHRYSDEMKGVKELADFELASAKPVLEIVGNDRYGV